MNDNLYKVHYSFNNYQYEQETGKQLQFWFSKLIQIWDHKTANTAIYSSQVIPLFLL